MTDPTQGTLREIAPGLWLTEKDVGGGWHNAMVVVRLRTGGLLVHSPTRMGDAMLDAIAALGPVEVLFAPNHFHNMGLPRYRERFPEAKVAASAGARPRLAKQGHRDLVDLAEVAGSLPEGARFLECEAVKTGEAFLSLEAGGRRHWLVCDAFFHEERPIAGLRGVVLRWLSTCPGLCVGQTFLWLGVADRARYRAWLEATLAREQPERIVVSHGTPYDVGDGAALRDLIARRLG